MDLVCGEDRTRSESRAAQDLRGKAGRSDADILGDAHLLGQGRGARALRKTQKQAGGQLNGRCEGKYLNGKRSRVLSGEST